MKRKPQGKRRVKRDFSKLQKCKLSVEQFLQKEDKSAETGGGEDGCHGSTLFSVKRKRRKELRKEKRKNKKAKMKEYYEGKRFKASSGVTVTMVQNNEKPTKPNEAAAESSEPQENTADPKQKKEKAHHAKGENKQTLNSQQGSKKISSSTAGDSRQGSVKITSSNTAQQAAFKKISKQQQVRKRALLEANVEEEKEIKRLEKYLGMNKRKNKTTLPQSFTADGLDYILGILEPGASASGLYESDEDMDMTKERLEQLGGSESELSEDSQQEEGSSDEDEQDSGECVEEMEVIEEEECDEVLDQDGGNEEDTVIEGGEAENTVEEPGGNTNEKGSEEGSTKYIPPHQRESAKTDDAKRRQELERLERNVKGLLNRLTEHNIASISSQLEELYMSRSRKDMNDTVTDILLAACVTPALMPERLLLEHVLLVSILHHTVGLEIGAHFLEKVVRKFEEHYQVGSEGKECDNLIAIIAHLYNFHVVHSLLIFDILKKLTKAFTEKDIELILFLLKNVGFLLRKDDAVSLKELISEAQSKANAMGTKLQDQTRMRFMLETMLALKNNDMRKIPGYDPEPVDRLRKLQRTLIHSSASGSDVCLRVSLENLLAADQVGRWWIVGSSWSGAPMIDSSTQPKQPAGQVSSKILELARKQRMNTDIRRNIFCVLMTSEDFLDAFEKLIRLGLKDQQERDIVHVLMDCCLQEKGFNPFYAVLGERFCEYDRRFQMTFQFSMWDKFRDLANLSSTSFSNLVHLLVHLLKKKSLSLSVLKVIEFSELDKPKVRFLRQLLSKLLCETEPEELKDIFGRISGIPKLGMLREGLKLFITHFLLKNALSLGTAEQAILLKERAGVAEQGMQVKDAKLKL
ncbi:nucleolar MIF4G domain-containing protein 1-like isoform X1 [Acipenser oxyrinchus oxyrinchus]|uniref:Nucleolar MIF4G domain-containing protein 1 n=1 Tax=Acipenser oxyrinchus oxyrinchus TaxID=40147 RepID=A0AAD8GGF7_ACIOX|nr:nucleolar MIF4G domain-containing protein 1-like isoform X1 [Acipenser oxyrinchus oxyrinchus]